MQMRTIKSSDEPDWQINLLDAIKAMLAEKFMTFNAHGTPNTYSLAKLASIKKHATLFTGSSLRVRCRESLKNRYN